MPRTKIIARNDKHGCFDCVDERPWSRVDIEPAKFVANPRPHRTVPPTKALHQEIVIHIRCCGYQCCNASGASISRNDRPWRSCGAAMIASCESIPKAAISLNTAAIIIGYRVFRMPAVHSHVSSPVLGSADDEKQTREEVVDDCLEDSPTRRRVDVRARWSASIHRAQSSS